MSNSDNRGRIEDYLFRRMSEEEEKAFVAEMDGDESLKAEVDEVGELLKILKQGERVRQYDRFKGIIEANQAAQKKSRRNRFTLLSVVGVAAAVVILLVLFAGQGSYIDQYFSPRPEKTSMSPSTPLLLKQGMNAYQERDFQGSLGLFEAIPDTAGGYNTACIYLANAHLALGNVQAALDRLLELDRIGDVQYEDDQRWLLGLIYLDQGEEEKGKAILRELYDDPSTNYKKGDIRKILGL